MNRWTHQLSDQHFKSGQVNENECFVVSDKSERIWKDLWGRSGSFEEDQPARVPWLAGLPVERVLPGSDRNRGPDSCPDRCGRKHPQPYRECKRCFVLDQKFMLKLCTSTSPGFKSCFIPDPEEAGLTLMNFQLISVLLSTLIYSNVLLTLGQIFLISSSTCLHSFC